MLTPTTPEGRAGMRAYCEAATPDWEVDPFKPTDKYTWVSADDKPVFGTAGRALIANAIFAAKSRTDFPRVLADLEWALERIEKAPHAISCEANYQGRFPCNCWKSEVRKR